MSAAHMEAARERFRAAVDQIAVDPVAFQRSARWAEFEKDLRAHLVPALIAKAWSEIGWSFEPDELPVMVMFMFIDRPSKVPAFLRADDPFKYACKLFEQWRFTETGRGVFKYENLDNRTGFAAVASLNAPSLQSLAASGGDPLELLIERESSPRGLAVERVVETIVRRTPLEVQDSLQEIVWWMSDQKLDEAGRRDAALVRAASAEFSGIDTKHLTAIARAVWGFRPNRAQSSLLLAFLRDPSFDPFASVEHFAALRQYRALMAA